MENVAEVLYNLWTQSGFSLLFTDPRQVIMILIALLLLYLGLVKKFEPLLLVGIAFGMLLTNLTAVSPDYLATLSEADQAKLFEMQIYHPALWDGYMNGTIGLGEIMHEGGLLDILYIGVKVGLYPSLIFLGVGAMTDFGPLLANPKSLLLGAAAQFGIFAAFVLAGSMAGITGGIINFSPEQAASIGIIGGADGPTAIWLTTKLAPELLAPIAIAAYSYMALIPLIQPPLMRLLTTEEERKIKMEQLRPVSKTQKILFPIIVTIFVILLLPSVAPLLGCLMLGNLFRECGLTDRLSDTAQNALMNIVTIFLSVSVGATALYYRFLEPSTIGIIVLGLLAFELATFGGLILGKIMCKLSGGKINPLIGSAGVSAVPMAARVSQIEGAKANPSNFLLMHAMGPNVAGVIGSAVAAGFLLAVFGG
jgi:oxaloacetate decarboxylase beta subunit